MTRQAEILQYLEEYGRATTTELARALGTTRQTAFTHLNTLYGHRVVEQQLVNETGRKVTYWSLYAKGAKFSFDALERAYKIPHPIIRAPFRVVQLPASRPGIAECARGSRDVSLSELL